MHWLWLCLLAVHALAAATCSASPLDMAGCESEAAIVCNNGHIQGQQGVALDDMVYVMTRMARQMEEVGAAVASGWHSSGIASWALHAATLELNQGLCNGNTTT